MKNTPMDISQHIRWFRRASTYINLHQGKTFVFGIPGTAMKEPYIDALVQDLCFLHSLGVKVVVCYGATQQINDALTTLNVEQTHYKGMRVTDEKTIQTIIGVSGQLRALLESKFSIYSQIPLTQWAIHFDHQW